MFEWAKQQTVKYKVLEVEKLRGLPDMTPDLRASLSTLQHNPAFMYLIQRLRHERAVVEEKLKSANHTDLAAVKGLQAGIYWIGWLENEVSSITKTARPTPAVMEADDVLEAFRKAQAGIEVLGQD